MEELDCGEEKTIEQTYGKRFLLRVDSKPQHSFEESLIGRVAWKIQFLGGPVTRERRKRGGSLGEPSAL